MRAYSFLLLFSLFIGFIEVFKCGNFVLMQPFVHCSGRENVVHSLPIDYNIEKYIYHSGYISER